MAGERTHDILILHGNAVFKVYKCLWEITDVVDYIPELTITFPTSYESQESIARGFAEKSYTCLIVV